jgi:hypothetical protein
MISVAIPVDDDCLVPVGIAVTISVDNDRLIAIGASISIGMDVNAARPYTNANVISKNGRYGANARDGHTISAVRIMCMLLGSTNPRVNSPRGAIVPCGFVPTKLMKSAWNPDCWHGAKKFGAMSPR